MAISTFLMGSYAFTFVLSMIQTFLLKKKFVGKINVLPIKEIFKSDILKILLVMSLGSSVHTNFKKE